MKNLNIVAKEHSDISRWNRKHRQDFNQRKVTSSQERKLWVFCLLLFGWVLLSTASHQLQASSLPRPWPDTTRGIHVFNDQLAYLKDTQIQFAATHYAGSQKLIRSQADRLHAVNPNFLILHYRLGEALGFRASQNGCQPTGSFISIIEGNNWIQEWPGDQVAQEQWFFHWPASGGRRVRQCTYGWYLAELNDPSWRTYWHNEVARQVQANDNDGVFMDSLSVPNYFGGSSFDPALPAVDKAFERAWSTRIDQWLAWLKSQPLGNYYLVPNVGSWITTRDVTTYGAADGMMLEGFALAGNQNPYPYGDWQLQMNRILTVTRAGKAIIGQNYATGAQERMFTLGCYLLIKGNRSFLNIDQGLNLEWWPEYDLPIGAPIQTLPNTISELDPDGDKIYQRDFDNATVLVNPTTPGSSTGVTHTITLGRTYYLAKTSGGGNVSSSETLSGTVTYQAVTSVTLPPFSAVVLFSSLPDQSTSPGQPTGQTTFALSVSISGSGTVGSNPSGIACPSACIKSYISGSTVKLTPTPVTGWQFTSWGGACNGIGACSVSLIANRSVTARFTKQQAAGPGFPTWTSFPGLPSPTSVPTGPFPIPQFPFGVTPQPSFPTWTSFPGFPFSTLFPGSSSSK